MWHGISRALIFIVGALLVLGIAPVGAQDGNEAVNLSIKPVGTPDSFFTITAAPGETVDLEVELANHGSVPISVQTYAANAYSLINGGFGVALADEKVTGTTNWIDYPVETFELDPQTSTIRSVKVIVPDDAKPGEYLSSVVIQNAIPTAASGSGVGFQQVNRQAIAIAIELPGEAAASLAIGDVTHKFAGGNSVVLVEVENTGNRHMKLEGDILLTANDGSEILARPVSMGTIYAGTSTFLEVPVRAPLESGEYDVSLNLGNEELGVTGAIELVSIEVPAAPETPAEVNPAPDVASEGESAPEPQPAAQSSDAPVVLDQPEIADTAAPASPSAAPATRSPLEPWMLIAGIAAALVLGAGGAILVFALLRRDEPRPEAAPAPAMTVTEAPAPTAAHSPVSGGSGSQEQPRFEPVAEPIGTAQIEVQQPARRPAQPAINQRSSTSVRNLLQATSFIRSDIPTVEGLRAEDWKK